MKNHERDRDTRSSCNSDSTQYDTFQVANLNKDQPKRMLVPYTVMMLVAVGTCAEAFCYENPVPFQNQLQDYMGLSTTKYNMFYCFYFLPNTIMPFLSGYFADRFGRRTAITLCTILVVVGHLLFATGITFKGFALSIIGRFIFGIGAESYLAVTIECLAFWNLKCLSFSLAMQSFGQGIGCGLNNLVIPYVYTSTGNITYPFWIGVGFALICLVSALFFVLVEWCALRGRQPEVNVAEETGILGVLKFPSIYWQLTTHVAFFYMGMNSFHTIAGGMAQSRFGLDVTEAGKLLCVPILCSIIVCPIFGLIIDRVGRYAMFSFMASVIQVIGFIIITCLPQTASKYWLYFCFTVYGTGNAIFVTSFWPCVKFIIPKGFTTTAYGLIFCIQDAMMFLGPILAGLVVDATKHYSGGYRYVSLMFLLTSFLSAIIGMVIFILDYKTDKILYKGLREHEVALTSEHVY